MIGGDIASTNWNGVTGWLLQRSGNLYAGNAYLRGAVYGGAYTDAYAWPAAGKGGGYHLSASGLLMGNPNEGGYFQIEANGNFYSPRLRYVNGTLTLDGPIINAASLDLFTLGGIGYYQGGQVANGRQIYGGVGMPGINGGRAPYTYKWTAESDAPPGVFFIAAQDQYGCTVGGSGSNTYVTGTLTLTVTDANGRVAQATSYNSMRHGTGQVT